MKKYMFEQGNNETRKIANKLRKSGYRIITSSLGKQVTNYGLIKTTMISILNPDGNEQNVIKHRDFFSRGI